MRFRVVWFRVSGFVVWVRASPGFEGEPSGLRNIGVRIIRQLAISPHSLYTVTEVR